MLSPHITALVATRLGIDVPTPTERADLARLGLPETTVAELTQATLEGGARVGIRYLYRPVTQAELGEALRVSPGPLVLIDTTADGALRARVLLGRRGPEWDIRTMVAFSGAVPGAVPDLAPDSASDVADIAPSAPSAPIESRERIDALVQTLGVADAMLLVAARVVEQASAQKGPVGPARRLLELIVEEKSNIGLVYLYATLIGAFSLTLPLGVQATIGLVSGGLILQPVVILVSFVVLGTLAYGVLQVMQLSVVETIQQRIFARFALDFVTRLPRLAMERRAGEDLTERMNRFFEVITVQKSGAKLLVDGTTALLQVVFGLLLLTAYHPYFAFFGMALVGLLALIFRITGPKGLATSLKESSYKYRAVSWLEEMARAAVTFKFAGRSTLPLARMDEHVSGYLRYRRAHFGVLVQQKIAMIVFKTVITGGLLVLGSLLVIDRQISLGQFVASEIVVVTVIAGFEKLIASLADVYDLLTSVEKLAQVRELELETTGGLAPAPSRRGFAVGLRDLGFRYPTATAPTLDAISLDIAPGQRVGIIGVFGSGESTFLRVLSGVYGGHSGTVTFDGITRADLDQLMLRQQIGELFPGEPLFEGTIEENVSLGRAGIDTAAVIAALRAVGAHDFVQEQPHGLRTVITAGGRTLPATMALRILLARAIIGRPRLLLLDEIFSTLAPPDRRQITALLTEVDVPWTLVAVSHDDEFLAACDRVLVLRDGGVVADGPWRLVAPVFFAGEDAR